MPRVLPLLVAFLIAANLPAYAQSEARKPLPDHLSFGYDQEGKVDATPAACEAVVKETVEWRAGGNQAGGQGRVCRAQAPRRGLRRYPEEL